MKYGAKGGPRTPSPRLNFKNLSRGLIPQGQFFKPKIGNCRDFELLKQTFLCNVYILLKRTDRGIPQRHKRDCAHDMPVLHCLVDDEC